MYTAALLVFLPQPLFVKTTTHKPPCTHKPQIPTKACLHSTPQTNPQNCWPPLGTISHTTTCCVLDTRHPTCAVAYTGSSSFEPIFAPHPGQVQPPCAQNILNCSPPECVCVCVDETIKKLALNHHFLLLTVTEKESYNKPDHPRQHNHIYTPHNSQQPNRPRQLPCQIRPQVDDITKVILFKVNRS